MDKQRAILFFTATGMFLMSMFYRVSSAIIAPSLSRDLGLSPENLGLIGAVFFYSFALVQFPIGLLLDRVGGKKTMIWLNLVGVAGALVFAASTGFSGALLGRALLGVGMAANFMGTLKLFSQWFRVDRFATLTGAVTSMGMLGSLLAATPLALLAQALTWRGSFLALAGVNLALIAALSFLVTERPAQAEGGPAPAPPEPPPSIREAFATLFGSWSYWAISLSIFVRYGAFASIQALWAGPFLMTYLGLGPVAAGNVILMLSVGFVTGAPLGGLLSDRVLKSRKRSVMAGLLMGGSAAFVLSQFTEGRVILLGLVFFVMGFFNSFGQTSYAHIRELMPSRMSGMAMSGINFFTMMGGGLFIHALGFVIGGVERTSPGAGYQTAFLICSMALFSGLLLYSTTRDARPGR